MIYRLLRPDDALPDTLPFRPQDGVVAVNDKDELVAVCGLVSIVHLDPLWVREDYRHHPTLLKHLWTSIRAYMISLGVKVALSVADKPVAQRLLTRLVGAQELPGRVYAIYTGER